MATDIKKWGGKVAVIALCVVAGIIVFRVLGGVIRVVLSIAILALIIFVFLKLLKLVK